MRLFPFLAAFVLILTSMSGCVFKEDSDGDGLPDNIEREGWSVTVLYPPGNMTYKTYMVYPDPHKKDTDGDGLTDYEEFSHPNGPTDPHKKDTDGDGLTDYEEVKLFNTNPLSWTDDIDGDNYFWKGDYEEIEYFQRHGVDNQTIREYLQKADVDGDGIPDGYDMDPLRNLSINITLTGIEIIKAMDGPNDKILEIVVNVSTDGGYHSFSLPSVIVGENESLNLSATIDLNDRGVPGNLSNSIAITVIDLDEGMEKFNPVYDTDGLPGMDIVKISNIVSSKGGSFTVNNFNITKDCHKYMCSGPDGKLWFSIEDASPSIS